MAAALTLEGNRFLRRGIAVLMSIVALGMGFCITRDSMAAPERGEADADVAQAVLDSGLTFGYATFWNTNILNEPTDGRVELVSIELEAGKEGECVPALKAWLEDEQNLAMSRPEEGVFLLLEADEEEKLSTFLTRRSAQRRQLKKGLSLWTVESAPLF